MIPQLHDSLRVGGRCEKHLSVKPCQQCADALAQPQPSGERAALIAELRTAEIVHWGNGTGISNPRLLKQAADMLAADAQPATIPSSKLFSAVYLARDALEFDRQRFQGNFSELSRGALDAIKEALSDLADLDDAENAAQQVAVPQGWVSGIEAVAKMLDKKADDYAAEYGTDDMGGVSFGRGAHADAKQEYHSSLVELAAEVRAMLAAAPQPAGDAP